MTDCNMNELETQLQLAEQYNKALAQAIADCDDFVPPKLLARKAEADAEVKRLRELLSECAGNTPLFSTMIAHSEYVVTDEFKQCVKDAVSALEYDGENAKEPVLLLGKIQCGKTNTFENIIALCMDKGFEIFVIFTKNSKALTEQTLERLKRDFRILHFNGEREENAIRDIMNLKNGFASNVAQHHRLIIVVKKQKRNLERLTTLFSETNANELLNRRVLIIDDEADSVSRTYRNAEENQDLAIISAQIENFKSLTHNHRYLQVTATPYSLFLQPNGEVELAGGKITSTFKPRKTIIVPTHEKYIGGKQYFDESQNIDSMYYHLHAPLSDKCAEVMDKSNKTYLAKSLYSENIKDLRLAIIGYFMAAAIRNIQEGFLNCVNSYKTSCIVHVSTGKSKHEWQKQLIEAIIETLKATIQNDANVNTSCVHDEIDMLYDGYKESHEKAVRQSQVSLPLPPLEGIKTYLNTLFDGRNYTVNIVNSDNAVKDMLNEQGQLRLDAAANIFIGGNVLDRGVTIDHLLTFIYGRMSTKQMDTAMQHERMYGSRSLNDMAVTRLYTPYDLYNRLKRIYEIDEHLRNRIANKQDFDVIEIAEGIAPTSANRVAISDIEAIKPNDRILPKGMQTGYKTSIQPIIDRIDSLLLSSSHYKSDDYFLIEISKVKEIIELIRKTYVYDESCNNTDCEWNIEDMLKPLQYATEDSADGMMWCLRRTGRNSSRTIKRGWADAPDTGTSDTNPAKEKATDRPVIMLYKENGLKENGWRGAEFYWPVMIIQKNIKPVIYTLNTPL